MLKRKIPKMSHYPFEKNEAKLLLGSDKDTKEVHVYKEVKDSNITRRYLLEQFSISIQD